MDKEDGRQGTKGRTGDRGQESGERGREKGEDDVRQWTEDETQGIRGCETGGRKMVTWDIG